MKHIKFLYSAAVSVFLLTACDPSDFGDMNVDPNNPSKPIASSLLTRSERSIADLITAEQGSLYSQQIANKQYTSADRYETIQWSFNTIYAGPLVNLQKIIDLNTDPTTKGDVAAYGSNNNQIAVARILKAYYFWHMTDRWGDIPYSQALKGNENFRPAYDTQEFIYKDMLKELKEAQAQIDGGASVSGDHLLKGNMTKWKKFANSMRLLMALRMSKVDPTLAKTEFNAALADGVIISNADNVVYQFLAEEDNDNLWEDRFQTRLDWTVSEKMINTLKELKDPRVATFADKALLKQDYFGMPYGLSEAVAGSVANGDVSFLGIIMRRQTSPGFVLTASQVNLAIAEAITLGWTTGNAEQFYNAGVTAGLDQYGYGDQAASYLQNEGVKFVSSNAIKQIATQRWITLFSYGYEAWAEWRRTGLPELTPPPANFNPGGQIPRRQGYVVTERDLNGENYNAAVLRIGGKDDLNGRVWWDK